MTEKNIVILVSGGGTNLQVLLDKTASGELRDTRIACVIASKPDAFALRRAEKAGVPTRVVPFKQYAERAEWDAEMLRVIDEYSPDLIVYAGFLYILSSAIVLKYRNRIINIHPALIPAFSGPGCYGLHVHEKVLARGVKLTGATVHFADEVCDGGPIILQKAVEVLDGDTPESLQRRVMEQAEWVLLPQAVDLIVHERVQVDENGIVRILK